MLKIALISILILFSIFVGLFPASEGSPHNKIATSLGYEGQIHYTMYICLGTILYLCAAFLSQQNHIDQYWK
jgi:hypothetical protein